ncbi:MAG: prolipoprotein diacylglyceryl transferase [Candidatus Woesearchaeota archaeon]|jgi:phosphatidylglycerol:prolipoprotein diacylglycerol transferase|nr:prolipoprotein diacylglyceryl transferase [Candidatus Woesearchaeota archaeon]
MINKVALEIFGLQIYWYGIVYALGFTLSYFFITHHTKALKIKKEDSENIFFNFMISSVLGGRLFEVLIYEPSYYFSNLSKIFTVWDGGMSIHGGILLGVISLYYSSKKYKISLLSLTDIYSIPAAAALAFGRLANFINQELVGKPTQSSLGIIFPEYDSLTRWPTQLLESAKNLITFQILYATYIFKKTKTGTITALFLILYSFGRFIIDFLREPSTLYFGIPVGQILNLTYTVFGLGLIYYIHKK